MFSQWLENAINHPRTSIAGVLTALLVAIPILQQQGITLGHAGTGTWVELVGALAAAFLGFIAKDPSSRQN